MYLVDEISIRVELPKYTDYDNLKPMLGHIERVIMRETGVKPKIEVSTIVK